MPIVSKNTKLDELSYVIENNDSYAPRTDRNTVIPVLVPVETSIPFVTVPVPKIEDKLPGTNQFNVNVNGAVRLNTQSTETILRDLPGAIFSVFGDINRVTEPRGGASFNVARFNDNFIRGGLLGVQQAVIRDYSRIDAFVKKIPLIFKNKQELLQRSNILFEPEFNNNTSISQGVGILDIRNRSIREYNVQNTVDQTAMTAFGVHYLRHGKDSQQFSNLDDSTQDNYFNNSTKNAQITGNSTNNALKTNRLLALFNANRLEIQSNSKTFGGENVISATSPPITSTISNNNPLFFNPFSRGNRGGTRLVTLNEIRQQAEANLRGIEDRIRRVIGNTQLGSVVLDSLRALNVNVDRPLLNGILGSGPISRRFNIFNQTNLPDRFILYQYEGGPNSLYGTGQTIIRRYSFTGDPEKIANALERAREKAGKAILNDNNQNVSINTSTIVGVSGSIIERTLGVGPNAISNYAGVPLNVAEIARSIGQSPIQGDRTYANIVTAISAPLQANFNQLGIFASNIDKQTYTNNGSYKTTPGIKKIEYRNVYNAKVTLKERSWSKVSREERVGSGKQDSINLTPLFTSKTGFKNPKSKLKIGGKGEYTVNDLVTFKIEGIHTNDPSKSTNMLFRAYITDFSDGVNAEWNDVTYVGRGDKFYIYKGFDRKIEIGFKVAALSSDEMRPMYQKLNNLMGNLLPDYYNSVMRGPLVRITVGNWIDSQPGILTSLSYTIPQDSPWEISIEDQEKMVLPHIVEVKLSFTPIGAQTKKTNKIMDKATEDQHTSYIAQNYNGDDSGEPNYIDGSKIESGTPYEPPQTTGTGNNTTPSGSVVSSGIPFANNNNSISTFNSLVYSPQQPTNYVVNPNAQTTTITTPQVQFPSLVNFGRR